MTNDLQGIIFSRAYLTLTLNCSHCDNQTCITTSASKAESGISSFIDSAVKHGWSAIDGQFVCRICAFSALGSTSEPPVEEESAEQVDEEARSTNEWPEWLVETGCWQALCEAAEEEHRFEFSQFWIDWLVDVLDQHGPLELFATIESFKDDLDLGEEEAMVLRELGHLITILQASCIALGGESE